MSDDNKKKSCELPFWKDISVLFKDFSLEFKPNCPHSAWNFAARLILISLFIGMLASVLGGLPALAVTLMFGVFTALAIIFTTKPEPEDEGKNWDTYHKLPYIANVDPDGYLAPLSGPGFGGGVEAFVNGGSKPGSVQPNEPSAVVEIDAFPYSGPMLPDYTPPTARNLFMNVLLDEIKYNPGRPEAAPVDNPTVKQTLDDYFRVQWFSDPTDVFGKNQSQRQFVTQPSTTVPNDQGAFADWLYKIPGKTCKEGGREACLAGTDGGPIPWLNQAS
jgi:hypothetical protein